MGAVTTTRKLVLTYDVDGRILGHRQVAVDMAGGGPTVVHFEGVAYYYTGRRTGHGFSRFESVRGAAVWLNDMKTTMQICEARPAADGPADLQGMNGEGI